MNNVDKIILIVYLIFVFASVCYLTYLFCMLRKLRKEREKLYVQQEVLKCKKELLGLMQETNEIYSKTLVYLLNKVGDRDDKV